MGKKRKRKGGAVFPIPTHSRKGWGGGGKRSHREGEGKGGETVRGVPRNRPNYKKRGRKMGKEKLSKKERGRREKVLRLLNRLRPRKKSDRREKKGGVEKKGEREKKKEPSPRLFLSRR